MDEHAREGVAILANEEVKGWMTQWREVSSRIMWMKLKIGQATCEVISAYGPGSERSIEEREGIWDAVEGCITSFDNDVNVVLLRDLNVRLGDRVVDGMVAHYGV